MHSQQRFLFHSPMFHMQEPRIDMRDMVPRAPPPPTQSTKRCGHCRDPGHTKASCRRLDDPTIPVNPGPFSRFKSQRASQQTSKEPLPPINDTIVVYFDTECASGQIIEIAHVARVHDQEMQSWHTAGTFQTLVALDSPVSPRDMATHIHGIRQNDLHGAPSFNDAMAMWIQNLETLKASFQKPYMCLVGHAAYDTDLSWIDTQCRFNRFQDRDDGIFPRLAAAGVTHLIDTLPQFLAHTTYLGTPNAKLGTLYALFKGQEHESAHRAMGDSVALSTVVEHERVASLFISKVGESDCFEADTLSTVATFSVLRRLRRAYEKQQNMVS